MSEWSPEVNNEGTTEVWQHLGGLESFSSALVTLAVSPFIGVTGPGHPDSGRVAKAGIDAGWRGFANDSGAYAHFNDPFLLAGGDWRNQFHGGGDLLLCGGGQAQKQGQCNRGRSVVVHGGGKGGGFLGHAIRAGGRRNIRPAEGGDFRWTATTPRKQPISEAS